MWVLGEPFQSYLTLVHAQSITIRDTVSSVGIVRSKELPGTTTGMKHVCFFRHALALDERRVKFLPEYACGGLTSSGGGSDSPAYSAHTQEVWFAGTHSDM